MKQVIRMASYRARVPRILGVIGIIVLVPALVAFLVTLSLQTEVGQLVSGTFTIVSLLLLLEAGQGWLAYNQWQFILTDKRIILITPDPDRRGFADVIYLKQKIQVLDTNFSSSPIWGLFQILQGSRDVMLSLGGYEFQEQGAKVKGGLRFPDVRPEDISQLEVLIFG